MTTKSPPIVILYRVLLTLSLGFFGLLAGTWLGGKYLVPAGQGMAGPVIALGYGVLAALIAAVLGLVLSFFLKGAVLKYSSLAGMGAALLLLGLGINRMAAAEEANKDPESEYAGVPPFVISWEQIVVTDPYLRVKVEVDSAKRRWVQTGPAPDHQVCRGVIRAKMLQDISAALTALSTAPATELEDCRASAGAAEQRLDWQYEHASGGRLELSPACVRDSASLANLVRAMGRATLSPTSKVKCD